MLKDKVIVVTGGAGKLGIEFIKDIIKNSGTAIIADMDEVKGNTILKDFNNSNIDYVKLDISSKESVKHLICCINKKYKKIDALVNCAYPKTPNYGRSFFEVEYEDFCKNINLHLGGYFLCSQQFSDFFVKQGYGNIINIASVYGVISPRFEIYENTEMTTPVEYAAIKSAVIHLTRYVAKYLKGHNVRVNCISPGGILDNQPESFLTNYRNLCLNQGMLSSNDICGTLIYLLSDMSKYVNGQNIIVDDGFML